MKTLEQILDGIVYKNMDEFDYEEFTNRVESELPGYTVLYVNMDDNEDVEDLANCIANQVMGKFVEDMQVEQWTTNEMDFVGQVIAIKLK